MAYRLAEANMRVCLLERGKSYPPNSFARGPYEMRRNFWDPAEGLYGLYDIWSFKGSGALVSSGLGGGSLIYANVLIRKDPKWFRDRDPESGIEKPWPVKGEHLETHYSQVERMMNAQKYPLDHSPYNDTKKTLAMRSAAEHLGRRHTHTEPRWMPLNLAVSFRPKPVGNPDADDPDNKPCIGAPIQEADTNYHRMSRQTCRLCGECDLGCNYGSKNTLDFNYITGADRLKAAIKILCDVKEIAPIGSKPGYRVTYVAYDLTKDEGSRNNSPRDRTTITCDHLILAAGTLGTPYLLLRNRAAFKDISHQLGSRYSVNGDLLSFLVKARTVNSDRMRIPRPMNPHFGPVITSAIRFGDTLDGNGNLGNGFYVEDGGNGAMFSWLAEMSGAAGYFRRLVHFTKLTLKYRLGLSGDTDLSAEIAEIMGECIASRTSLPVLTMGRDCPDGKLFLSEKDNRFLECDWRESPSLVNRIKRSLGATIPRSAGGGSEEYYRRVRRELANIAEALGAKYMDNPSFKYNFGQVLTAHPLGGAPMGNSASEGVVDSYGQVFNYPGLYIADGSVMPGPVGPNPSLTIAALSNRFAEQIIENRAK